MKIINFDKEPNALPTQSLFSFEKIIKEFERYAKEEGSPFRQSGKAIMEEIEKFPELRTGIANLKDLEKYGNILDTLLKPLFSDPLQENEIKAVIMPFTFTGFHPTKRFSQILANAGNHKLSLSDFGQDKTYMYACSFILGRYYQQPIDLARPIFLEIPNQHTGETRHYRAMINGDFLEVIKKDAAPEISAEDISDLLRNGNDLELWKKKFPPNSYILKGFGIINLFDVTQDVIINKIRALFLRNDNKIMEDFQKELSRLMNIKGLKVGYSTYETQQKQSLGSFFNKGSNSLILDENERSDYENLFCQHIQHAVMNNGEIMAISDTTAYGKNTGHNTFYQRLKEKNIGSIILVPLKTGDRYLQLLEIAAPNKNDLNSLNANKLRDIIPFIEIAAKRFIKESINILESTIQENYTSIHPTVKWRFDNAAIAFNRQKAEGLESPVLEDITFDNIYPLYAQSDIKGSSVARNLAVQEDLIAQLKLVIQTFETILAIQDFPIYKRLIFKVQSYLSIVDDSLDAGDEVTILEFLKEEIYPVFRHLKNINPEFATAIDAYMAEIDPNLHVVYRVRKTYDDSVSMLNDKMARYLDKRQAIAQKMFPHYFQRYKTDGVEYNIYIGDALVQDRQFHPIYLQNLRLWQLETMWGIEQVARQMLKKMPYPLEIASLILVHSHPLSIKFHMDQKAFDVDGAYNARYEIIKKRIDKSHIKGTTERLTQPGKIAIVYSQDSDAAEYLDYLKYWQSEGLFGEIEAVELEDLQGISGLKAIRVEVLYQEMTLEKQLAKLERIANA